MSDAEELFGVRNHFFMGNYQQAISESYSVHTTNENVKNEKAAFVYRAQVALGNHQLVINEVNESSPVQLQAAKLLATYTSDPANKEIAIITLKEWLNDPVAANNPTLAAIACTIYMREEDYESALKCVHQGTTLEMLALSIQVFLKINRLDLAQKQLATMAKQEDDAPLTQLAGAWLALAQGGSKAMDAHYTYQELAEKYDDALPLLNGNAVALTQLKKYDEAEQVLMKALGKAPTDADTLFNLVVCLQHARKPAEVVNRFLGQLKNALPDHPYVRRMNELDSAFLSAKNQIQV